MSVTAEIPGLNSPVSPSCVQQVGQQGVNDPLSIEPSPSNQLNGAISPSPENILSQCNHLLKDAKNFNLHANILKQLLNLKDRSNGYDIYARRPSIPNTKDSNNNAIDPSQSGSETNEKVSSINNDVDSHNCDQMEGKTSTDGLESISSSSTTTNVNTNEHPIDLETLLETINKLREEVIESHRLGFCLAYNIQCLHKRLTGSPIDLHSSANMIRKLQEKYDSFKTREAILKYEFQEKRKLLRRLRYQLEETREDWKLLRVKRRNGQEAKEEDALWSEALRRQFASKRKQPSEESGFIEASKDGNDSNESSEDPQASTATVGGNNNSTEIGPEVIRKTGYEDLAIALDNRRAKLDLLEDECEHLFASLSSRSGNLAAREPGPTVTAGDNRYPPESEALAIAPELIFPDDEIVGELLDVADEDDDDEGDEDEIDEDELSDPLSDEFDELNLPVDALEALESIDNTEEADMSDLPWDSNNLYESRATSLITDSISQPSTVNPANNEPVSISLTTESITGSAEEAPPQVSTSFLAPGNMVHIGVGMDDEEDEYTEQEMESIAETGEPLVLCRLRRRAVEILVSRLRDEKILHESRESELKEQIDELKRLNDRLTGQIYPNHGNEAPSSSWINPNQQNVKIFITSMMTTLLLSATVIYFSKTSDP